VCQPDRYTPAIPPALLMECVSGSDKKGLHTLNEYQTWEPICGWHVSRVQGQRFSNNEF
jgi:hypothetical protein